MSRKVSNNKEKKITRIPSNHIVAIESTKL